MSNNFSQDKYIEARALYMSGIPIKEICEKTTLSRSVLIKYIYQGSSKEGPWKASRDDEIKQLEEYRLIIAKKHLASITQKINTKISKFLDHLDPARMTMEDAKNLSVVYANMTKTVLAPASLTEVQLKEINLIGVKDITLDEIKKAIKQDCFTDVIELTKQEVINERRNKGNYLDKLTEPTERHYEQEVRGAVNT